MLARACMAFALVTATTSCAKRGAVASDRSAPPVEPTGAGCLTHAKVENLLEQLRASTTPDAHPAQLRLVTAECRKRAYVVGPSRFVLWESRGMLRGKATKRSYPQPSPACIERGLAMARDLAPFAGAILDREVAQNAELWRDPDVGAVSYLECERDQPSFDSIATMLHETNHRISRGACVFDFSTGRELCFALAHDLPPGTIAAYPSAPVQLDPQAARWFQHVQALYLEQNGQGIRELVDEVMAYRVEAELHAIGVARKVYPKPGATTYINMTQMMALTVRYLNELARHHPAIAAAEFGPQTANRAATLAVLDQAEATYKRWLAAVKTPGSYERTFWDDYQRGRAQWLLTR
ncbi:MAG TPA: hypothetical protein VM513_04865 [Kofleriaceae bacterium]|nr:hypothetical protein [Kofleriaceae bacterium]